MNRQPSRRQYLATLGIAGIVGVAGCSQDNSQPTATPTRNIGGANFTFEYDSQAQQVTIQYNGGATIQAGNLQVRSSSGMQRKWSQLGSTTTGAEAQLSTGKTAVLGADILNWGQAVGPSETIRLVYASGNGPSTLGRFTPTETSKLTSTVPSTPTPEPTATPPADTTAPSITAFSLSNPSGQELRTSFESDEDLASIEVLISGGESTTLTTDDFSESIGGGKYTYEATYQVSSDGDYTAALETAADDSGNDGGKEQSVTVSVSSTAVRFEDTFDDGEYADTWEVKPGHSSSELTVTESGGYLRHNYDDTEGGGNLITVNEFDSTGTIRLTSRMRPTSDEYKNFGQVLSFGPDGNEGGVSLREDIDEGLDIRAWGIANSDLVLDTETVTTGWREYSFTVDFENEVVTQASRGDETYDVDIDISEVQHTTYVIEIGNGTNHDVEYDYIRVEEL